MGIPGGIPRLRGAGDHAGTCGRHMGLGVVSPLKQNKKQVFAGTDRLKRICRHPGAVNRNLKNK